MLNQFDETFVFKLCGGILSALLSRQSQCRDNFWGIRRLRSLFKLDVVVML